MTPAFKEEEEAHNGIYIVWYIIMILETIGVLVISIIWKMLSFKKTHLMERMSLLTLIVIGEGAIGVTKTVSRMMGKNGLDVEGCSLIMCIIAVLVLLWALYFDNFPHGHYGTIRQQLWSLLHFPFQLAIVGVVEGSQQVALARYVLKNYAYIEDSIVKYCYKENLDGEKLRDKLATLVHYWQFEKKLETYGFTDYVMESVYVVGNTTGICSPANATSYVENESWPIEFYDITQTMFDGVYQGIGIKLPVDKLEKVYATEIAIHSWKVCGRFLNHHNKDLVNKCTDCLPILLDQLLHSNGLLHHLPYSYSTSQSRHLRLRLHRSSRSCTRYRRSLDLSRCFRYGPLLVPLLARGTTHMSMSNVPRLVLR